MHAEIVVTGTELLLGEIVDTNSTMMARMLRDIGLDLHYKSTVGDNRQRMAAVLNIALDRSDIVLVSGGLGPTVDDVTREAVADATGRPLVFHQELLDQIAARFARFGRQMTENNRRQSYVPEGAIAVENPVGTAPAFIVENVRSPRSGAILRQLTDNNDYDGQAEWSPDGREIAFMSTRDGTGQIYILNLEEGKQRRLITDETGWNEQPAWSPDGRYLAYMATITAEADIYLLDLESGASHQLTAHSQPDDMPLWSPDGSQRLFESPRGLWWLYRLRMDDFEAGEQPLNYPQYYLHRLMRPLLTQRISRYPRTGSIDRLAASWAR